MQVGVKAPGTANMTILPFVKTSLDFFFAGPSSVIRKMSAFGRLLPSDNTMCFPQKVYYLQELVRKLITVCYRRRLQIHQAQLC